VKIVYGDCRHVEILSAARIKEVDVGELIRPWEFDVRSTCYGSSKLGAVRDAASIPTYKSASLAEQMGPLSGSCGGVEASHWLSPLSDPEHTAVLRGALRHDTVRF
jgi:hypothetical protein